MAGLRQLVRSALSMPQCEEQRAPSCVQPSLCVTGSPRCGSCSRRRALALPHARRLCAAVRPLPPPCLDGRKCVPPTTSANVFVALTQCDPTPKVRQPAHPVAPSLAHPLADRARPPRPSRVLVAMVPKFAPSAVPRQHGCPLPRSTGGTRHPRSGNLPTPSRHRSSTLSQTGPSQTLGPRATLTIFSGGCASWVPGAICSVGSAIPAEVTK